MTADEVVPLSSALPSMPRIGIGVDGPAENGRNLFRATYLRGGAGQQHHELHASNREGDCTGVHQRYAVCPANCCGRVDAVDSDRHLYRFVDTEPHRFGHVGFQRSEHCQRVG